jgi:predicted aminopeptidase
VRSAYFQAELLHSRVPVESIRQRDDLSSSDLAALDRIDDVKDFGSEIGLSATENYETYADNWDRTIWNLTACPELTFTPVTWTFPIVGKVPYLGFFLRSDADAWAKRLERDGNEVFLRTAGAYSTLGWFRDPVLPGMLKWKTYRLANTVLHELAHATLWVKGSVSFNESFASFVGDKAAFAYLADRFGTDSDEYIEAQRMHSDLHTWRLLLKDLYEELDAVYQAEEMTDEDKRSQREVLYESIVERAEAAPFNHPERFIAAARKGPWNNARMMQYRTYNTRSELFAVVYDNEQQDLLRFIGAIGAITKGARDPYEALEAATAETE